MRSPHIEFTPLDRLIAGVVGVQRTSSATTNDMSLEEGRKDYGIETHVVGAMAELAVARYVGANWSPKAGTTDTETGDVGGRYQVKSITNPSHSLVVRMHDPEDFIYVLCLVTMKSATVLGWMHGKDARDPRYIRGPEDHKNIHRKAYFVPQSALHSPELL